MNCARPYTLINMAISADGKIASTGSRFSRFGSPEDEANLYRLRGTVDAILCGATTVIRERATLTAQRIGKKGPSKPYRVLVTATGSIPTDAPVFKSAGGAILILSTERLATKQRSAYEERGAELHLSPGDSIDWQSALRWMETKKGIKRLLCEGGGKLNQALIRRHLVDEINLTVCPIIVGGTSATTMAEGTSFPDLENCSIWKLQSRKQIGDECFLRYISATTSQK